MTEISKMFENAGIKKCNRMLPCPFENECEDCEFNWYPDFTAEKQLELIKWLAKRDYGDYTSSLLINITDDRAYFSAGVKPKNKNYVIEVLYDNNKCTDFENALANLINNLWQSFTDQEKEEIRGILND